MSDINVMKFILLILSIFTFLGCASGPSYLKSPAWQLITIDKFLNEVEEKSGSEDTWHYSGTSESYHYFFRSPGRIFVGKHKYFKIEKSDYHGIPESKQVPFDGNAVSRSLAFSKIKKDRSGFTHSLSRGLVDNVLIPSP